MSNEIYNFDEVIDRRNTDSVKYDFAVKHSGEEDILPLWIADMDFKTSDRIIEAVRERVEHGVFGYTECGEGYYDAVRGWMRERHGWETESEWIVKTPSVVFGLAAAVRAFTSEGDAVLIQQPVYPPFMMVISDNGRRVVSNDLVQDEEGKYVIDFEDFERKVVSEKIKLFILCSPHNPVGRVWTRAELERLAEICVRCDVIVVSDEIHEDFVLGGRRHIVFASLGEEVAERTITCTAPSKTFNLVGLQLANIFISNPRLRSKIKYQIEATGYSELSTNGLTSCEAAYRLGGAWYEQMLGYVGENHKFLKSFVDSEIPELGIRETEGTYLAWIDFRGLGLKESGIRDLVMHRAKLFLNRGSMFGKAGEGFERVNVACARATLERAGERLRDAVRGR